MDLKNIDPTRLMAALQAAGYAEDEIEDVLDHIEPQEQVDVVPEFQPKVFVSTENTITLGHDEHKITIPIRSIGMQDILKNSSKVQFWYEQVGGIVDEINRKLPIGEINPLFLGHHVVSRAIIDAQSGKYTRFAVSVFESIAELFSSPGYELDAEFIAGCLDQLEEAFAKYLEVNRQRFLALISKLPEGMSWQISTLITMISAIASTINQSKNPLKKPTKSTGGTKDGGSISSSTPSRKKRVASKKQKSAA